MMEFFPFSHERRKTVAVMPSGLPSASVFDLVNRKEMKAEVIDIRYNGPEFMCQIYKLSEELAGRQIEVYFFDHEGTAPLTIKEAIKALESQEGGEFLGSLRRGEIVPQLPIPSVFAVVKTDGWILMRIPLDHEGYEFEDDRFLFLTE